MHNQIISLSPGTVGNNDLYQLGTSSQKANWWAFKRQIGGLFLGQIRVEIDT